MRSLLLPGIVIALSSLLSAQSDPEPIDKRAFGVLPNYRTADGNAPYYPITARQKFAISIKDSTDWPVFPTAAAFAALYQLEDQNPSFGQGAKGYGHRFVTAYGDQIVGNIMIEGLLPSVLHEDPRYFRRGYGSVKSRLWYAGTRIFVNRTDRGTNRVNLSELVGNGVMMAVGNAYYPDTRGVNENLQRLYIALATDSFGAIAKEFWPDVKRRFFRRNGKTTGDKIAGATAWNGKTTGDKIAGATAWKEKP
jgi:hypothetical protein